jgi:hypothetical protein
MEQRNEVYLSNSLEDLKQKLNALDFLMHSNAMWGEFKEIGKSTIKNYSKSNPFTNDDKSITN